jgi:hypothetical protein
MSYEEKRFKGPCILCNNKTYRKGLCLKHYKEKCLEKIHCTVLNCHRPLFVNTLCRSHFKCFYSKCRVVNCNRHTFSNHMCEYHYRRIKLPPLICTKCNKKMFVMNLCFKHYLEDIPALRKCIHISCCRMRVSRGMCKKHYVAWRRLSEAKE